MTRALTRMGDWIFFCAVLLVLLFGCAQVTAALIQQVPSNQERLMALETWRQQHQVDDNKQFTDIEALQKAHSADMLATSTRITTLEVEFVNVDAELTNIIHILIAVAGAVMLQLAHWPGASSRKSRRSSSRR